MLMRPLDMLCVHASCLLYTVIATTTACYSILLCVGSMVEVVSLRSLPDYTFDPDEAFADVCVTGADGAGAAPSADVAHASSSVSNVKRQTTITAFFK